MTQKENFSHSATILPTRDIQKSIDFYTKKLEFSLNFTWEDPVSYAVLKRGEVNIHLSLVDDPSTPLLSSTLIYVFVHDVDSAFQQCKKNGIEIKEPIDTRDYKMRDFEIIDPDGHRLTIGNGQ